MEKIINVEQADIKTATIEVKVITVSSRQLTLSVFRQIKEESIFDWETGQLSGVPWGNVNYFWGDDKDCNGIHLLWQLGVELRRCVIRDTGFRPHHKVKWETQKLGSTYHELEQAKEWVKKQLPDTYYAALSFQERKQRGERLQPHQEKMLLQLEKVNLTIRPVESRFIAVRNDFKQVYRELASLDQLFIAV